MKPIIGRLPILLLAILALTYLAYPQRQIDKGGLPNFYKLNDKLYRGAQPNEAGIRELARLGIRTVIDLRADDALAHKEETQVRAAGMRFISIPLSNWFSPRNDQIDQILAELDFAADQPIFIHCNRGADRTGTVIAVYRMTHEHWSDTRAINEAKSFHMGWWQVWMKGYIHRYYREHVRHIVKKPV